jgi:glycosyltransferase involved in cell wall biosynthesis
MRIGFDAKRYFFNRTGLGNYSRGVVHALAQTFPKDEFVLFTPREPAQMQLPENITHFAPKTKNPLWRLSGVTQDAHKLGIDVFHGLSNELPWGLKSKKIVSVVTIHDVIFKRFPAYYKLPDRLLYDWKTKHALKTADRIVVTSQATAADLEYFYGIQASNCEVVFQPVQDQFYTKSTFQVPEVQPYFIYVSSFTGRKNHNILIEAFAKIKKLTDHNLVLIGSAGETLPSIQNYIQHEKLEHRVKVIANASQDEVVAYMQQAAAFVYPSPFEGFGIPLAEAAVCGLPMAVSNIDVFQELAGNAARYFHPNKAEEIADAMLALTRLEELTDQNISRQSLLDKIQPAQVAAHQMKVYQSIYST